MIAPKLSEVNLRSYAQKFRLLIAKQSSLLGESVTLISDDNDRLKE